MNAQDLKNSILQLAVQGKLVEQRAEEGTARELFEQIKLEKDQLIKDKKIKKSKPLPEITEDEIPFEIPESWEWVRLGELISIESGKGLTSKDMKEGEIPVFGGNGITGYHNEALVNKETVVIGRVGFYCGSVHLTPKEAWVTDNAFITTFPDKSIDTKYLIYILRHMNLGKSHNATAQPVVSGKKIYPLLFPLPPLEEQHRIVAKIEEILPYIDQYDKAYTKLETFNKKFPEDMKKSILQMAMQGKLVEQLPEEGTADELYEQIVAEKAQLIKDGKIKKEKPLPEIAEDEIPFEIPSSWKWVYINEIAFVTKLAGFEYTKYMANSIMPYGEVPIVRAKNIKPNSFRENKSEFITMEISEKLSRCALDEKCVLMTFIGAGIGEVAVFDNIRRNHLAPNVAKIVPYVDINYFLMYYLMSAVGQAQVFQYMKQTAQPSLSMEVIRKVLVPLPPLEEQQRIVAKIEELLPYCDQLIKN
ncbi:restriction endonuclease subunit S [Agathobacter rectalis]|uniref:Restriction endonuclease subunit S n=1 Tax=Agathobacter rectalis TaxID=39491 RepID=A0A414HVR5_9FIRM|nr:restriction endonuclease subunit S [Agathobacter rectalis]RHD92003.1 restriction endonuclease subunit S [Agathobacter rectalis]